MTEEDYLNILELEAIFNEITEDSTYQQGIEWNDRKNGLIRYHIADLEKNLRKCWKNGWLSETEHTKLRILIHVHDTLKYQAKPKVSIEDPHSHASLAKGFLAKFCNNEDLLNMIQYQDEPIVIYYHMKKGSKDHKERLEKLIKTIKNWRLFLLFQIIDNCLDGKDVGPTKWLIEEIANKVETDIDPDCVTMKETQPSDVPPGMND